jgi:heat shock protein HslJ
MRTRLTLMIVLVLAALVLAACGSPAATPAPTPEPPTAAPPTAAPPAAGDPAASDSADELAGTSWLLSEIAGAPPVSSDNPAELEFNAEGGIAGSTGCNRFFGSYTVSGDTLSFGQLGSTMMACPDEVMQQETSFLQLMGVVASYSIVDDTLTLSTADGQSLVFTRA